MDAILIREAERLIICSCAPILLILGYKLFLSGATGNINLSLKSGTWSGKAANVTPGALCFLLGVGLGIYILQDKVNVTYLEHYRAAQSEKNTGISPVNIKVETAPSTPVPVTAVTSTPIPKRPQITNPQKNNKVEPASGKMPPPVPEKPSTAVSIEKFFRYDGIIGKLSDEIPLSLKLRLVLSELYFCDQPDLDHMTSMTRSEKCVQSVTTRFGLRTPLPDVEQIKRIEELERRVRADSNDLADMDSLNHLETLYFDKPTPKGGTP